MKKTSNATRTTKVALATEARQGVVGMLTGNQLRHARQLAGFKAQADLAKLSGVSRSTIARAELSGDAFPKIEMEAMIRLMRAIEAEGVGWKLPDGASPAGGLVPIGREPIDPVLSEPMRIRRKPGVKPS
jgi:transcriptional regulator with XRE-family HTH domain